MKTAVFGLLAGLGLTISASAEGVVFGKDFTLTGDPIGGKAALEEAKDKPILLYWGSIKCPRCTAHTKDFARFSRTAEKKGIEVIAIQSEDADEADLIEYIDDNRIEADYYPSYKRLKYLTSNQDLKKVFNGIPLFIVIAPGGNVISWHRDIKDAKKALKKLESR